MKQSKIIFFFIFLFNFLLRTTAVIDSDPISEAINKINHYLEHKTKRSVIFLGHEGVGKSTLACLSIDEQLTSHYLNETGQVVIKSNSSPSKFMIKDQELSDDCDSIIIPSKADTLDGVAIWDIPGFSENEEQKIFISYCLSRIIANSEHVKVIIVTSDASLQGRATIFFSTIKYLTSLIKPDIVNEMDDGIILIVSHVPKNRTIEQVKNQINNLKNPTNIEQQNLLNALRKNIYIFTKAEYSQIAAENLINSDIKRDILKETKLKDFLNSEISSDAKIFCEKICETSVNKLNNILSIIIETLKNPLLSSQKGEDPLSKSCLFIEENFLAVEKKYHEKEEDFVNFNQIKELYDFAKNSTNYEIKLDNAITLITNILNNLESYTIVDDTCTKEQADKIRKKLQKFNQEVWQQMIYIKTFSNFLKDEKIPKNLAEKIIFNIQKTQYGLQEMLLEQINILQPDINKTNPEYFKQSISLLSETTADLSIKERQAKCYERIGDIYKEESKYKDAGLNYCDALELFSKNYTCHRSLGQVLCHLGLIKNAVTVFQAILDTIELEKCSNEIVKINNWQDREFLANAWFKVGNFNNALIHYQAAASIADMPEKQHLFNLISQLLDSGEKTIADTYKQKISNPLVLSLEELKIIRQKIIEL